MIGVSVSLMLHALNTRLRALVFLRLPLNAVRRFSLLPIHKSLFLGWQLQNKNTCK